MDENILASGDDDGVLKVVKNGKQINSWSVVVFQISISTYCTALNVDSQGFHGRIDVALLV